MTRPILIAVGICATLAPAAALAAGVIETAFSGLLAPTIVAVVMAAAGGALATLAATSERYAAPRRAKAEAERTLLDRAIIEADRQIDMVNLTFIETFVTRYVNARLPSILASPQIEPLRRAEDFVDHALSEFERRNPQIAAATGIGRNTMTEILGAAIGAAQRSMGVDPLAAELRKIGLGAVDVPPAAGVSGPATMAGA